MNWDSAAGAGSSPLGVLVVVDGTVMQLTQIGTQSNYFVQAATPSSCTTFAFGAQTATKNYRYPEGGNVLWGCAGSDYAADAQTCGSCSNGICFKGTCAAFTTTLPPKKSASSVISAAFALVVGMAMFAMMF